MANVVVALSPFFGGKEGFLDEVSGIHFKFGQRGELQPYDITRVSKLEGIKRAVRLNVLLLVEGSLDDIVQEVTVEKEPVVEAPKEEVAVETPEVTVEAPLEDGTVLVEEVKPVTANKKRK